MSLLDIAKANGVESVINEASRTSPELKVIPTFELNGLTVRSVVYTGQSNSGGSFRSINAGTAAITETSEERDFQCFTAEPRIEVDRAEADRYEKGPQAWIGGKATRVLAAEFLAWCKQFYYGSGNNASGFPGLINIYDSANMLVDAGGTTASTGSSVWLVRAAAEGNMEDDGVRWRMGMNGKMTFDPVQLLPIIDPNDSTKKFMAYLSAFTAYPGIQVQHIKTVCRISKLTEDSGHTLTDALLNKAVEKFLVGKGPTDIFMSQRSRRQLQSSRTATNPTGKQADWPDSIQGPDGMPIKIHSTEAINNAESLTL